MSNVAVILQILFITLGMLIFGIVLNRILGISREKLNEFREKASNLQERMRNAQVLSDPQLMLQLQRETIQLTKQIMVKQLVPMCLRCSIFIGIFAVLTFIYTDYDSGLLPFPILFFGSGWFSLYFLFSISISLIAYGVKRLYKKLTGREIRTQKDLRELMQIISPAPQRSGFSLPMTANTIRTIKEDNVPNENDSWKKKIQK